MGAPATLAGAPAELRLLSEREFGLFQGLIQREAGIYLSEIKKALLVGRLARRVRELGLGSFGAYFELVERDPDERVRMLDRISTNETHFFREPRQFEFLEQCLYPAWAQAAAAGLRPKTIRAWSAACSSGEEPYSLAMSLLESFPRSSGWDIEILASDISTGVLARAEAALWPVAKSAEIPQPLLKRYMLKGVGPQEGRMKAGPELRALVRFARINLAEDTYVAPLGFDLVFCRNVLIYFRAEDKLRVLDRLLRHLAPGGHLLLGHAESVTGLTTRLRSVGPNVYAAGGAAGGL